MALTVIDGDGKITSPIGPSRYERCGAVATTITPTMFAVQLRKWAWRDAATISNPGAAASGVCRGRGGLLSAAPRSANTAPASACPARVCVVSSVLLLLLLLLMSSHRATVTQSGGGRVANQ